METVLVLRWYLVLQLFGLAALPLTWRLLRRLPGRGYAFARPLGLLVGGWVFWLLGTFEWLPNTAGSVLVALGLLAAAGMALWLRTSEDDDALSISWRHVLVVEILFALAFVGWCLVRANMPRIEHAGGEKWMEIAFLNSVLRAPQFPPHDPWLSGFAISYYYFGYLIVGMLVRVAAVPTTIGFNLGIASLFALTCTGAYGLVYNLLAARERRGAVWGGLLGPVMLAIMGNLEGLLEVFHARGLFPAWFWTWLDIRSINRPPVPFAEGSWIPNRFIWWWQASRVLHDYAPWHTLVNPVEWEVIDEFPGFSFLLGDMHPHLLALPFVLLALALALAVFFDRKPKLWKLRWANISLPMQPWRLMVYAVCLGGLGFLNTWDFPIYLFVVVVAVALVTYNRDEPVSRWLLSLGAFAVVLAGAGFALYFPFWLGLRSQAAGIAPNLFNGTRLVQFLVMFAPLLIPVAALVIAEARRAKVDGRALAMWSAGALLVMLVFLALAGLAMPQGRQYLDAWRSGGPIPGLENVSGAAQIISTSFFRRIISLVTPLAIATLLAAAVLTLLNRRRSESESDSANGGGYGIEFAVVLALTAGLLAIAVEFVYLRDNFGTRMNTVFKFYFQAWVMWGIAGAYSLARAVTRGRVWGYLALMVVAAGLVYPTLAIPARARMHDEPATLDGAAHLRLSNPADFAAIDWLNRSVSDVAVILEAPADRFDAYAYEGRVSAFTGLPTLLGWAGHEHQWRGNYDEPAMREPDIETLYTTQDLAETWELLERYEIEYVYVGPREWSTYPATGLLKFSQLLEEAYNLNGVVIYRHHPGTTDLSSYLPGQGQPHPGDIVP